jgi:5-methylcytosine-specific restriction endonuclease McrA
MLDFRNNIMLEMQRAWMAFAPPLHALTETDARGIRMADNTQAQARPVVTRQEARELGLKRYFLGSPCKRGHISERRADDSDCIECVRHRGEVTRLVNPERIKSNNRAQYLRNREVKIASARIWSMNNPEKRKVIERRKDAKVRATTMGGINRSMSCAVWRSLQSGKCGKGWESLVGYSIETLKIHLERQFLRGMTWENRGSKWHIDHVIPLVLFHFNSYDDPEFKAAWALTNLRPLWKAKNLSKGGRREHLL